MPSNTTTSCRFRDWNTGSVGWGVLCADGHEGRIDLVIGSSDVFELWLPLSKIVFGVVENLASLMAVLEDGASVTWNDGSIIEKVQETTAVAGENDLLLGALDGCSEFGGVCFLELLATLCGGLVKCLKKRGSANSPHW